MLRTHIRKIFSDLRKYRFRTALVSASIFIGVLGTVALFSMGDIIVSQIEEDLNPIHMAMLNVTINTVNADMIDNDAHLVTLTAQPEVTVLQAYAEYEASLQLSGDVETVLIRGYSTSLDSLSLEPLRVLSGRYPMAGQVAITPTLADQHGLSVGDAIELSGATRHSRFTISGIVFAPYDQPEPGRRVTVFAEWADLQTLSERRDFTALQVRFADFAAAEVHARSFIQTLAQDTPYIPVQHQLKNPAANEQLEEARTNSRLLQLLAVIALVVSGFLVANTIGSLITEQRTQIGMMKALGARSEDLIVIYAGVAVCYGVLGIVPGVLLGVPTGSYAAQELSSTLGTHIDGFTISITAVVYGVLLGLLVPVIAALFPVTRALNITILRAIADNGITSTYGTGHIAQLIARIPMPATIRQSLNNLNRQKTRLAFTLLTMTIAVAAFMGVFAVLDSVIGLITNALDTIQADIVIQLDNPVDYEEMERLLSQDVEGLRSIQPGMQLAIKIEGYNPSTSIGPSGVFASGYDTNAVRQAYQLTLKSGVLWDEATPQDGIVITQRMAETLDVAVGDMLAISVAGQQETFPIIAISTYPFDGIFMDWRVLARVAGFMRAGEPVSPAAMIMLDDDSLGANEVDDMIADIQTTLEEHGITASYQNFPARSALILSRAETIRAIFSAAVFFIALTGALGLLTTLSINVFERRLEIGIMRSVGASSSAIGVQFLTEGAVIGLLAWLTGIPLSIGLSLLLSSALAFGDAFRLVYPLEAVLFGLIGIAIITALASVYPALSASRQSVSEILRYQ